MSRYKMWGLVTLHMIRPWKKNAAYSLANSTKGQQSSFISIIHQQGMVHYSWANGKKERVKFHIIGISIKYGALPIG